MASPTPEPVQESEPTAVPASAPSRLPALLMRVLAVAWLLVAAVWAWLMFAAPAQSDARSQLAAGVALFADSLGMLVAAWIAGRNAVDDAEGDGDDADGEMVEDGGDGDGGDV